MLARLGEQRQVIQGVPQELPLGEDRWTGVSAAVGVAGLGQAEQSTTGREKLPTEAQWSARVRAGLEGRQTWCGLSLRSEVRGVGREWLTMPDAAAGPKGVALGIGSLVAQTGKAAACNAETGIPSLGGEVPLEKKMATHSSTLAWKNPWTEEPGRLQSMGFAKSQTGLSDFTFTFGIAGEGSWGGANWDEIRQ